MENYLAPVASAPISSEFSSLDPCLSVCDLKNKRQYKHTDAPKFHLFFPLETFSYYIVVSFSPNTLENTL